jgi:hypothetical protein
MLANQISRPNYYQGQYLGAEDFRAEQKYHRDMQRRHNIGQHTWGIVAGLELVERPQASGDIDVYLYPGMAVDGYGREILVLGPLLLDATHFQRFTADDHYAVWIGYEEEANQASNGYTFCADNGNGQFDRVREKYRLFIEPDAAIAQPEGVVVDGQLTEPFDPANPADLTIPADKSVPYQELPDDYRQRWMLRLGSVHWDGNKFVAAAPGRLNERRLYASTVTSALLAPSALLHIRDRSTTSPLPVGSPGVAVRIAGSLEVDRDINTNANALLSGNLGIGTTTPAARLDIAGTPVTTGGSPLGSDIWLRAGDGDDDGRVWVQYGPAGAPLLVLSDKDNPPRIQFQQTGTATEDAPENASWIGHAAGGSTDIAIMNGRVGIAETNPQEALHVQGRVRFGPAGNLFALGALTQALRVVAGHVSSSGGFVAGSGFGQSRTSEGRYAVTFTPPFAVAPIVLATSVDSSNNDHVITVRSITATGFDVAVQDTGEPDTVSGPQDNAFTFVALGLM